MKQCNYFKVIIFSSVKYLKLTLDRTKFLNVDRNLSFLLMITINTLTILICSRQVYYKINKTHSYQKKVKFGNWVM